MIKDISKVAIEITNYIEGIRKLIESVLPEEAKVRKIFEGIYSMIEEISSAAEEQASASEETLSSMESIKDAMSNLGNSIDEVGNMSKELENALHKALGELEK